MKRSSSAVRFLFGLGLLATALAGCAPHYSVFVARDFVVLKDSVPYDFRATTADGFVIGLREFDNHESKGDLAFWREAVRNQLVQREGYALLASSEVKTTAGLPGTRLELGLDQQGESQRYDVCIFVTEGRSSRVYLLEAGGSEKLMKKHRAQVDWTIQEFVVR